MVERLKQKGLHALIAWGLCMGTLMPLLGVLHPQVSPVTPLLGSAAILLLLSACSLHRRAAIGAGIALPLAALIWLFRMGGTQTCSDVMIALSLRLSGQSAALPLVMDQAVLLFTVGMAVLCFFATLPQATYLPSLLLCVAAMMLIWLSGSSQLIPWLIPALAALLLLMAQDRHASVSPLRLMPWLLVLAALAFLIAPKGGETVEPLREKAEEWRQAVLDRLFFTEARDVFSLSSEGYYPQGTGQLGGTPTLSDHPVMQVSTPKTAYLRGVILNTYDGHAWSNTTGSRRYLWQSGSQQRQRDLLFDESLPALTSDISLLQPAQVSIRMLSDSASTLFVPQRIRELHPGGGLVPYFSNASELFVTRNLTAGDTYAISALLLQSGDPGIGTLIDASASFADPSWEGNQSLFTPLPGHLEQQVYALAREITATATTPYEQAYAIQTWLGRNCRYTLEVEDHPTNVDFVTRFLFQTREGYCTYFASAMTVLCRMVGLPARYVEGYVANPNAQGQALVTGLNAHAWTEVYFKGFGWLTFDATPQAQSDEADEEKTISPEDDPEGQEDTLPPEEAPDDDPEPTDEPEESEDESETSPEPQETESPESPEEEAPSSPQEDPHTEAPSFPWWLLFLLLPAAIALRAWQTAPQRRSKKTAVPSEQLNIWAQEIMDLLRAENCMRRTGETLLAFMQRMDQSGRFSVSLSPVGEVLSLERYSPREAGEDDVNLLRDCVVLLRTELSRPAKARYWLTRIFTPVSRRLWFR